MHHFTANFSKWLCFSQWFDWNVDKKNGIKWWNSSLSLNCEVKPDLDICGEVFLSLSQHDKMLNRVWSTPTRIFWLQSCYMVRALRIVTWMFYVSAVGTAPLVSMAKVPSPWEQVSSNLLRKCLGACYIWETSVNDQSGMLIKHCCSCSETGGGEYANLCRIYMRCIMSSFVKHELKEDRLSSPCMYFCIHESFGEVFCS